MDLDRYMSRRSLLRAIAGGAVAMGVLPLLAACGDDEDEGSAGAEADPEPDPEPDPEADPEAGEGTEQTFSGESLVIYSGRSEELVSEIIERFEQANNLSVEVRYGDTAELAAQLLEEGDGSPADVYFAQDAGALGAVAKEGLFTELPENILERVDERFRSPDGNWVGVSGRARAVVYNTEAVGEADIPASILDFTDPVWKDRLGWAPTNGSFQAFVTALRVERGDDVARDWLEGIIANNPTVFEGNNPIVTAVNEGEIDAGFVNHYYLLRQEAEAGEDLPAANYIYKNGDPGALVNVAGVGVLASSDRQDVANAFVRFLLEDEAQQYFADETYEYPLIAGVTGDPGLVPLAEIETPDIDLSDLDDLEGTLEMLRDVGLL